jgi:hypothetical protein
MRGAQENFMAENSRSLMSILHPRFHLVRLDPARFHLVEKARLIVFCRSTVGEIAPVTSQVDSVERLPSYLSFTPAAYYYKGEFTRFQAQLQKQGGRAPKILW